jgi:hypothetical protein
VAADVLAKAIFALTQHRNELAHGALASPAQPTAYEYGRVAGHYAGLTQALEALERIFRESTEVIEHDGTSSRGARTSQFGP